MYFLHIFIFPLSPYKNNRSKLFAYKTNALNWYKPIFLAPKYHCSNIFFSLFDSGEQIICSSMLFTHFPYIFLTSAQYFPFFLSLHILCHFGIRSQNESSFCWLSSYKVAFMMFIYLVRNGRHRLLSWTKRRNIRENMVKKGKFTSRTLEVSFQPIWSLKEPIMCAEFVY